MLSAREVDSRIEYLTAVSDLYGSRPLIWIGRFTETVPVTDPPGWVLTCMVPVIVTPATVSEPE